MLAMLREDMCWELSIVAVAKSVKKKLEEVVEPHFMKRLQAILQQPTGSAVVVVLKINARIGKARDRTQEQEV
jgi:hypothetical protein